MNSFNLSDKESTSYKVVVKRFESHFIPKRNVIYEREKFNLRSQLVDESVDTFVTALHSMAEKCYGGSGAGVWRRYSASNFEIKPVNTQLLGPCSSPLKIQGEITTPVTWRGNTITVDVYVVQGLKEPLLGRSAIESLGMLQWLEEVNHLRYKFDLQKRYPKLFEGLGLMAVTYTIRLKNDAVPVSLHAPSRVVLPLQLKLKQEIDRLVNMGIISPVDRPTEWCSGIVTVPKQNGQIRLCVDLTALDKSVQTERTILPAIDDSLALLRKTKIFQNLMPIVGTGSEGVEADPAKIEAIRDMPQPQSVTDVRRLLGMVNYVGKFVPNLAEITEPIHQLLKESNAFLWEEPQELAFKRSNNFCTAPQFYFTTTQIRIFECEQMPPHTEERHTSHHQSSAPCLVSILGNKSIDELPPRLQRYRMRLMRYTYQVKHVSGKHFYTPDTLSRTPAKGTDERDRLAVDEIEEYAAQFMRQFPASDVRIEVVRRTLNLNATPHTGSTIMSGILAEPWGIISSRSYINEGSQYEKNKQTGALVTIPTTSSPMGVVGMDLAERDGTHYLVIIDYYPWYPEIFQLPDTKTSTMISRCKAAFSRRRRREEDEEEEWKGWPNLPAAQEKGMLTTSARTRSKKVVKPRERLNL
ncbi:hypothetical protein PR048_010224 [Dryococelus australis]|uniref:Uncharacterized protein n=1 Tax=Dryococelus australis TaxID=614101 RepID=A0ABQ9I245_9NEOP|nr:hypothetical protein PR048_010224 [Dryococelus australis]